MITRYDAPRTHLRLLKDLREIKAVLEVESELFRTLMRIAQQRHMLPVTA